MNALVLLELACFAEENFHRSGERAAMAKAKLRSEI